MKYIRCGYGETHDVNTDMVFVDDVIHEYKHETVDNVEWHDEMTQDEITIMTEACDKACNSDIIDDYCRAKRVLV